MRIPAKGSTKPVAEGPSEVTPGAEALPVESVPGQGEGAAKKPKPKGSRYIPLHELLRRTYGDKIVCPQRGGPLGLIALVKWERTIRTLLAAMHMPTGPPKIEGGDDFWERKVEKRWGGRVDWHRVEGQGKGGLEQCGRIVVGKRASIYLYSPQNGYW